MRSPRAIDGLDESLFSFQAQAISAAKATALFEHLRDHVSWQQPSIQVFGKWHRIARLQCYMGDADASYAYSGKLFTPEPWLAPLQSMRQRLELQLDTPFNAVLINYYRNGLDTMGWHSDDEPELGEQPVIASVSLGALRKFKVRNKATKTVTDIALTHGSLLLMKGQSQSLYQHSLPKQTKVTQGRINLTFRHVQSAR